jgi:hypothetical protein
MTYLTLAGKHDTSPAKVRRHPGMGGVIMKWLARRDVGSARSSSPHSRGEWDRWFAWYPIVMATSEVLAHWVWLEFVERKWSTGVYGSGKKRRYRPPKPEVRQQLRNLSELTRKLDAALTRSRPPGP